MLLKDIVEIYLLFDTVFQVTVGSQEFTLLPKSKYIKRHPALAIAIDRGMRACKTEHLKYPAILYNAHFFAFPK